MEKNIPTVGWSIVQSDRSDEDARSLESKLTDAGRVDAEPTSAFEGKDLSGLDLSNRVLIGLRLRGSCLKNTLFYNTVLYCCDLRQTDLSGANLRRSQIRNSSLAGAKVTRARFCRMLSFQGYFQGLWYLEKMFTLEGGYTIRGPIPIDVEDLEPVQPSMCYFPIPTAETSPTAGKVWDFSQDWNGRQGTMAEAAVEDKKDDAALVKLTENATEDAITRMGSLLAASVPSVEKVCKQAQTVLNTAINKARMLLEKPEGDARRRLEDTVALIGKRSGPTALAAHVEGLLREELNTLLNMFVHDLEVLIENEESPAGSEELTSFLALLIDDLRRRIDLHAQPHIKKVAGSIAARVDPNLRCGPARQPKEITGDTSTSGGPGTAAAVHPEPQDESFQAAAAGKSRAAKVEEEAAWDVYADMLGALLSELEKALNDPAALVQAAVLRQGKSLLCRAGFERRLASLRHHTKELEARTRENLSSDDSRKLGSFGVALESNMRNVLRNQALRSVSRFATRTLSGLAKNMLTMKPTELVKNIDELEFLRKQIEKLADADVTEATWLDFFETWQATLALRSQVEAEAAQHMPGDEYYHERFTKCRYKSIGEPCQYMCNNEST